MTSRFSALLRATGDFVPRIVLFGAGAVLLVVSAILLLPAFPLDEPTNTRTASARVGSDRTIDTEAVARNGDNAPAAISTGRSVRAVDLALPTDEVARMLTRGQSLMDAGDFAGARLFLTRAADAGSPDAVFALASTYDPKVLSARGARGLVGEPDQAFALYQRALAAGIKDAGPRLEALQKE